MKSNGIGIQIILVLIIGAMLLVSGCWDSPTVEPGPFDTPTSSTFGQEVATEVPIGIATPGDDEEEDSTPDDFVEEDIGTGPTSEQEPTELTYIYQDELEIGWNEWSWDIATDYESSNPVFKDQHALSITPEHAWAGYGAWFEGGFDATPYAYLNVAIQASEEDEWYTILLLGQGGKTLSEEGFLINPPVGSWEEVQIPLSQLGGAYTQIFGLRIMNTEEINGTYYLDEVGFGGVAPAPTATPIPEPQTIQLSVDAGRSIEPFSNEMLGLGLVNWEHSWDKYFPAEVPHLTDVFKIADVGLVRYAGGLWANWVGWERLSQRDPYTEWQPDPANYSSQFGGQIDKNNTYTFHYGINEIDKLAQFSQETGSQIMIQVNVSMNDPYMWADLLHYTNVENDYNFKYWELGNELDLETSRDSEAGMDASTYQERVRQYAKVLRSVDPNIVIVGGVPSSGHDIIATNWAEGTNEMSRYLTAAVDGGADSLSYHWYQSCNTFTDTDAVTVWTWPLKPGEDGIADPKQNWRHSYSRIWSQIGPERVQDEVIPAGSPMTQGITELNYDSCDHEVAPQNSNHLNAVWLADILGRLAYNGLDYATWYTGYGTQGQGYPVAFTVEDYYPETVYLRPSYYTLFLYANYFGDQLLYSSSDNEAAISIWASTDSDDPNSLKLIVTNISNSIITSPIEISGFRANSGSKVVLSNPSPLDMTFASNDQSHGSTINGVTLDAATITTAADQIPGEPVTIEGNRITETFPPYSVTAIRLTANG